MNANKVRLSKAGSGSIIARNSFLNLAGQILPLFVGVFTIPYIIKGLGTDGFGIISIAWMLLGYFSILDLGLSRATTRFVSAHLSPDKISKIPGIVWTSLALLFLLGLVGAVLLASLVPLAVSRFLKMPQSMVPEARNALYLLCSALPLLLVVDALRGVLEAAQRFDLVNYVKVPASISFYLLSAIAIPLGFQVSGIVFLLVLSRFFAACAYLMLCFKVFPILRSRIRISREAIRPLVSFGGWVMVTNTVGPIFGYLERFLIASVLSVGMLSYYSAPYELVSRVLVFPGSIAAALFPFFSSQGDKNNHVVADVTARTMKYLLLVMTPITALFLFFSRDILQIWLGNDFANNSAVVLQILSIMFFLNAFALIPFTSVQALGRPDLKAILDVIALPIYAFSSYWLLKKIGINGAALAKLLVTIVDFTFLYVFAWRLKAFSVCGSAMKTLFKAFLVSGGLLVVMFGVGSLYVTTAMKVLLIIVSFIFYLIAFWRLAIENEERSIMRHLFNQMILRRP